MSRLIDGDMLIANLKRYNHETVSVDGLEALVRQMPTIPDRMKLVQQAVDTIMSTSRSYSIRDRAFRNAARLIQNAIDGKAPDFEQIPEGDEMPPERKQGTWLGTAFDGYADGYPVYFEWQCSECGCVFEDEEPTYNFCQNCGADMRGGQE